MTMSTKSVENVSHEETYLLQKSSARTLIDVESESLTSSSEENDEENPNTIMLLQKIGEEKNSPATPILKDELRQILQLAVPVTGTYLFEMLPGVLSIILVGHIDSDLTKEYMDAAALSTMLLNITALSVGFGLASAMDTLCSQAYGANETHRMGTYFHTGIIVLSVATFFVFWANFFAADVLIALGQPIVVAELAGEYSRILALGIPFLYVYELLRKILQAQNIAAPMLIVAVIANIINIGLGYYLVNYTSSGWLGAAIARTVSSISFPIMLIFYLYVSKEYKTFWSPWNLKDAISGLRQFIALGIPGMLQLCFEWWAFEVLAIICGLLPNPEVAIGANAVLLNTSTLTYMFYLGISVSGNVRVGNALGAGCPKRAKLASQLVLSLALVMSLFCAAGLLVYRNVLPMLFTHDAELDAYSSKLLYIAALFQIPDSVGASVQGIFRGSGRQSLGANMCFVAYFVCGIPLGTFLAFQYELSVYGLWCGMTVGIVIFSVFGIVFILKSDWVRLVKDAKRIRTR